MSSEWSTKAENQRKYEHGDEHSALFYLFQEVSKLASPVHNRFLDTNPASRWLNDTSKNSFNHKREEEEDHSCQGSCSSSENCPIIKKDEGECSFHISHSTCQQSLSCMLSYSHIKTVSRKSPNSNASALDELKNDCNSPCKVLSLINLQCERLLHQSGAEELNTNLLLSATQSERSTPTSAATPLYETGQGIKRDKVDCSLIPSHEEGELAASATPVEDLRLNCSGDGVKDADERCVLEQTTERRGPDTSVLQDDSSAVSFQPVYCYREESGVNKQSERYQECLSTRKTQLDVLLPENVLDQTPDPDACLHTCVTFSSNYSECIALSKPALTLDHNANITLSTEPPCDTLPPPPSALELPSQSPLVFNAAKSSQSLSEQDDKVAASKLHYGNTPIEEKYSSGCDVSSATSQSEPWMEPQEGADLPSSHRCRRKARRKQPHPSRSADIQDPDFQGVTFRIDTELDDTREQCRLLITSNYSKEFCKSGRKPKLRTRTSQKSPKTSSSDEENNLTTNTFSKVCASCCTRKTPMWRHAEDGTPLCNACGIRYKKYRVRCVNCWHIPRKEGNSKSCCLKCGNFIKLHSTQRKHSS